MNQQELDKWNERRFQICMKLIDADATDMSKLDIDVILNKADRLIDALKAREEEWNNQHKEK